MTGSTRWSRARCTDAAWASTSAAVASASEAAAAAASAGCMYVCVSDGCVGVCELCVCVCVCNGDSVCGIGRAHEQWAESILKLLISV